MKRNLLLGWISLFGVLAFAQEDPVVMRINGKEIPRSEVEYSYRRHTDVMVRNCLLENMRSFSFCLS